MLHHRVFGTLALSALLLTVFCSAAGAEDRNIVNPWVATDRSVNCFDRQTLVADVTRGLNNPQDQAVALYSFFRRSMFPYTNRNEYPFPKNDQQHMFDFLRMVNVYGYALCSQTAYMFASLCSHSGLFEDARPVNLPGHSVSEVKWNGSWHFFDTIAGAYAFRRDRREIASIEDIAADTTLLTRAAAEGRASVPFCPWDGEELYPEKALIEGDSWFTYRKYGLDFLCHTLPEAKPQSGAESITHTMAFDLRPGYKLTRLWDNLPDMFNVSYEYYKSESHDKSWHPSPAILSPHNPVGAKEQRDTVNFPVVKPYLKIINGRPAYHYYANGMLTFEDCFDDDRLFQAADSIGGLELARAQDRDEGLLRCPAGVEEGAFVLRFQAPYVFVGGEVSLTAQVGTGSWAALYLSLKNEKEVIMLGLVEKSGDYKFALPSFFLGERYAFSLKVRLHNEGAPNSVNLRRIKAEGVCQLNMYSLPYLAPGRNMVTVSTAKLPQGAKLAVTYQWREKGWDRTDTRIVTQESSQYRIDVAGVDYPRMKSVTLEYLVR